MEIKTCPCCGGMAETVETAGLTAVVCLDCDLKIERPSKDLAVVIGAWNRRVRLGMPSLSTNTS